MGRVCSSGWSPYQQCGVAIICIDNTGIGPVAVVDVVCADGEVRRCQLWTLPMCDAEGLIPRGKLVEMPEVC